MIHIVLVTGAGEVRETSSLRFTSPLMLTEMYLKLAVLHCTYGWVLMRRI